MTEEVWRSVVGYEGIYEVSNTGKVKSFRGSHGKPRTRLLKGTVSAGYQNVCLYKSPGIWTIRGIHRLVAEAFLENPGGKYQVNHKDFNRRNNHVRNLEWVTQAENMKHAWDAKRFPRGIESHFAKLTEQQVIEIRRALKTETQANIARRFGRSKQCIQHIASGNSWKHIAI